MKEKNFQTKFTNWLVASDIDGAFELKLTKTKRFSLSQIRESQWHGMTLFQSKSLTYKIPDEGPSAKPFDCFKLSGRAYLALMFYERGTDEFYLINIDALIDLSNQGKKSITKEDAAEHGDLFSLSTPYKKYD